MLVRDTCDKNVHPSVGGAILSAIITPKKGMEGRTLESLRLSGHDIKSRRLTLTAEQIAAFYGRQRRRGWRGRSAAHR